MSVVSAMMLCGGNLVILSKPTGPQKESLMHTVITINESMVTEFSRRQRLHNLA